MSRFDRNPPKITNRAEQANPLSVVIVAAPHKNDQHFTIKEIAEQEADKALANMAIARKLGFYE